MTNNRTFLGIELGSTRIKAIQIDEQHRIVASGAYTWTSRQENGIWTYDLAEAANGIKSALAGITDRENISCMGISAMMHGYLAFDQDWNLLVPFRTWQNTTTRQAAEELTSLFRFNIPQRWSISHLYQAILNKEPHVMKIAHITTLAGYIHYKLTGVNAVGIGEASGMFPVNNQILDYDAEMLDKFTDLISDRNLPWTIKEILPKVLIAGEDAGKITISGSRWLNNMLPAGISLTPPEGDAGTGMTATNAIAPRAGNVSAGTSIFAMVVLERPLKKVYPEIDIVTTPVGNPVAMVHCNNGTNDMNAWAEIFREFAAMFDMKISAEALFTRLYEKSLSGEADCSRIIVYNYLSGEGVTHADSGRPLVVRKSSSNFNLANFIRAQLYSTIATLRIGMDILDQEAVKIDSLTGHGGLFKTPIVGQKYLAAACRAPIICLETAGEGGAYGMALLAAYKANHETNETLEDYLNKKVFADIGKTIIHPDPEDIEGFSQYMEQYKRAFPLELTAIKTI